MCTEQQIKCQVLQGTFILFILLAHSINLFKKKDLFPCPVYEIEASGTLT